MLRSYRSLGIARSCQSEAADRVVAQEQVDLALPHERHPRLGSQVRVVAGAHREELERLVGLAGVAVEVDELRLDDRRAHVAAIGLLELGDGQPRGTLAAGEAGLLDRPGLPLDLEVDQAVLDLLHGLVELVELLLELGLLLGSEVAGVAGLEGELEPVAGQVDEAGLEEELEQLEVQATGALAAPRGSWAGAWSGSRS